MLLGQYLAWGQTVMKRHAQLLRQPEFHIWLFCILFLLSNWPLLAVSASSGLMSIFCYLFVLWSISIVLLFLIQRSLRRNAPSEEGDGEGGD